MAKCVLSRPDNFLSRQDLFNSVPSFEFNFHPYKMMAFVQTVLSSIDIYKNQRVLPTWCASEPLIFKQLAYNKY